MREAPFEEQRVGTDTEVPAGLESPAEPQPQPTELEEPEIATPTGGDLEQVEPIVADREERTVVTGTQFRAEFTNRGAQLVSFQLLEHESDDGPVDLIRARPGAPYAFGFVGLDSKAAPLNDALFAVTREVGDGGQQVVSYRYRGPLGEASKQYIFEPNGLLTVEIVATNESPWAVALGPGIRNPTPEEVANRFARRSAVYRDSEGVERIDPARVDAARELPTAGLLWVGLQDTYFLTAVIPREGLAAVRVQPVLVVPATDSRSVNFRPFRHEDELSGEESELDRELFIYLQPEATELNLSAYLGDKRYERLAALPYGLDETIQMGWFKFLSVPLLLGLRWIHDNIVANYGWAIILMTLLIRLVLFPLTHKSTVSMQKMQEVNPKVQAIRQKYRGKLKDKQGRPNAEMQRKMNEETMALYKAEGVNPAGGCLPMLLQIPVLFAFYSILSTAIEIRHAPWILWIQDLSAKDPFYVLPIVMGATQFLQQKMTPAAGDPMQRRMFALMPVFFTILFLGFPSGLVLYWLTNNVLGIGQQLIYKRVRDAKAADEQQAARDSVGKKGRGSRK